MERLSKEEFLRRWLRDRGRQKLKEHREKEEEIITYLAQQKGKRKYEL